jgi:hypothetical protein
VLSRVKRKLGCKSRESIGDAQVDTVRNPKTAAQPYALTYRHMRCNGYTVVVGNLDSYVRLCSTSAQVHAISLLWRIRYLIFFSFSVGLSLVTRTCRALFSSFFCTCSNPQRAVRLRLAVCTTLRSEQLGSRLGHVNGSISAAISRQFRTSFCHVVSRKGRKSQPLPGLLPNRPL